MTNIYKSILPNNYLDYQEEAYLRDTKPHIWKLDNYLKPINTDYFKLNHDKQPSDLEELSVQAEEIHTEVHLKVISELGHPFKKRYVYASKKETDNGCSMIGFPGIIINSDVAGMNNLTLRYLEFCIDNEPKKSSPEDFFRMILSHEYGHQVFDEFYKQTIGQVVDSICLENPGLKKSADEAFAFWFGEELTGMEHLNEDIAQEYSKTMDSRALKFLYSQLKTVSEEHGTRYVIDNLVEIITDRIARIEDVTLERSAFLETLEKAKPEMIGSYMSIPKNITIDLKKNKHNLEIPFFPVFPTNYINLVDLFSH